MTNRIVQLLGYGFGATDATIEVTLDGNTIYTGTVPTLNQPVPPLPNPDLPTEGVVLCSFEIPVGFVGTKPMTCRQTIVLCGL